MLKMKPNCLLAAAIMLVAAPAGAQDAPALKTPVEKQSYAIGVDLARNLKKQGTEIDAGAVAQGLKDALAGRKLALGEDEIHKIMTSLRSENMRSLRQNRVMSARENNSAGAIFLLQNKTNAGVVSLPSGLQYKILSTGQGRKPTDADTVECRYRGTLVDGSLFDASASGGPPSVFKVSEVIPGWKEALKLMPAGSKWQLFIPPNLAYGMRGKGTEIGPSTTLVFELELVNVR